MAIRKVIPWVALAIVAAAPAAGAWYFSSRTDWVRVTTAETLAVRDVVFEPEMQIYVVHTDEGPLALSAKVPHEVTDYVLFCRRSGLFEAAYLSAKFDRLGIYYGGSGERSLDRVKAKVEDGVVYVAPDETTPGPARGEREPVGPRGGFCQPT